MELIEEIAQLIVRLQWLTSLPIQVTSLPHEVDYLGHRVFLHRFVSHISCGVIEAEQNRTETSVTEHQREPADRGRSSKLPDR